MEAFPECIKDGVPEFIKDSEKDKSFMIDIAEKVIEPVTESTSGKVVSPHFRRGFYRRLSSDYYKNKKGQIIFVSETMVNGKAKTVYTTEKIKNIDK
jgi:hypothetical protein